MAKGLTVKGLEAIKPSAARQEVPDGLVPGLYFVMQPSGGASWAVRYRAGRVPKKLTLGRYPAIELGDARELAKTALIAVASGRDPAEEKKATRLAGEDRTQNLVENVVTDFINRYAKKNTRPATWAETERIFNAYVLPKFKGKAAWKGREIGSITRRDILALLDALVDSGAPVMANRTLAAVRRFFAWCVDVDILAASPCGGIKAPSPEQSRDRSLSDDELRLVIGACKADGWPFGPFIRLLLLTAQRRDEVADMQWREIDLRDEAKAVWTIPAERTKNGIAQIVPLCPQAVALLKALPKVASRPRAKDGPAADFVFSTNGESSISGFSRAKERIDAMMLATRRVSDPTARSIPHWTLHDLRRTAATGMARLGVQMPVVEKILNHTSGSFGGVAGVYQRFDFADEKAAALAKWAAFLDRLENGAPAGNVVQFREAAS